MSSPAYVVGEFTVVDGLLALKAADRFRELTTIATEMKIFRTRQAAHQWREYRTMNGRDARDLTVIRLPIGCAAQLLKHNPAGGERSRVRMLNRVIQPAGCF